MPIEYVNRQGDRYYLLQGKTKTGKPKYYVSLRNNGTPVERMPAGFELYESPERGLVSVRRIRPTRVSPLERAQLERWVREWAKLTYFRVEIEGDALVVYAPDNDERRQERLLDMLVGSDVIARARAAAVLAMRACYYPIIRFNLIDERARHFSIGGDYGWLPIVEGADLKTLAREHLPRTRRGAFPNGI